MGLSTSIVCYSIVAIFMKFQGLDHPECSYIENLHKTCMDNRGSLDLVSLMLIQVHVLYACMWSYIMEKMFFSYPGAEKKRLNALIEERNMVTACDFLEDKLPILKSQPYPTTVGELRLVFRARSHVGVSLQTLNYWLQDINSVFNKICQYLL